MNDGRWRDLLLDFLEQRIDGRAFHDRFFDAWRRSLAPGSTDLPPSAIETLFFVVEAYCPDPLLRDHDNGYEADDAELRTAARTALCALQDRPHS
jgi:hypothetical protein